MTKSLHFQICASYCSTVPNAVFAGVEDGTDCYCGAADEDFSKNGALDEDSCATLCFADPGSTCGGLNAIEVRVSCESARKADIQEKSISVAFDALLRYGRPLAVEENAEALSRLLILNAGVAHSSLQASLRLVFKPGVVGCYFGLVCTVS